MLNIGAQARRKAFWSVDFFSGRQIKSHYLNIKKTIENGFENDKQLNNLLLHTCKSVPYYMDSHSFDLLKFPIVNKLDYKENAELFISNLYRHSKNHKMTTSGSTGVPFTFYQDINKRKRVLAEIIFFNEICGQLLGEKYIYFRVWTEKNRKTIIERFKQNLIPIDILYLDNEKLEYIKQVLIKDKSVKNMLGYASTFSHLANFIGDNSNRSPELFNVKTIVSGSEILDMEVKRKLKNIFGCNVIDRYSAQENGIVAQSEDMSEEFNINYASYFVELLKIETDEPSLPGELSRIIVTDLYNYAMPMIRYDTGDLAIRLDDDNMWVKKIKTIQGRQVDTFYDTSGRRMTAHTWSVYMWKFDKLKQYQFIQEDEKKYVLKICGGEGIYPKETLDEALRSLLGSDAEIVIEYVDKIPVLSSGKFKKTICNYVPL